MTLWCAFLCGINLGNRRMKMADLKAAMEAAGFADIKTVLASGNVRFTADGEEAEVKARLEAVIKARFGFPVRVVLRTAKELAAMREAHPFDALDPAADLTRHVILYDEPLPAVALDSRPGDTEILRIDRRELYLAAYRQPNGRYTEHVEDVLKPLGKALGKTNIDTARNWNTIEKMLK
jgi:uncharacterized protein (DUF1697 family)